MRNPVFRFILFDPFERGRYQDSTEVKYYCLWTAHDKDSGETMERTTEEVNR